MKHKRVKIFGVRIDCFTKNGLISELKSVKSPFKIAKVNTEFLLRAKKEGKFKNTLNSFNVNVADGIGVAWAAKFLNTPLVQTPLLREVQAFFQVVYTGLSLVFCPRYCRNPVPHVFRGVEMMDSMLKVAEGEKAGVYIFGSGQDTLEKAVKKIKEKFPKLKIAGFNKGYDFKDSEIIKKINESEAQMLFVALGSPKQEYWIRDNLEKLETVKIAVGEGGSLEFIAGTFKRAPKWMRNVGLEWFWRLFFNPSKTPTGGRTKRVWNAVPVFVYNVLKYKLTK